MRRLKKGWRSLKKWQVPTGTWTKTIRKQPQTQMLQGIYVKHQKIAEIQVY